MRGRVGAPLLCINIVQSSVPSSYSVSMYVLDASLNEWYKCSTWIGFSALNRPSLVRSISIWQPQAGVMLQQTEVTASRLSVTESKLSVTASKLSVTASKLSVTTSKLSVTTTKSYSKQD